MKVLITSLAESALAMLFKNISPVTKKYFGGCDYYICLGVLAVLVIPARIRLPQNVACESPVQKQTVQTAVQQRRICKSSRPPARKSQRQCENRPE